LGVLFEDAAAAAAAAAIILEAVGEEGSSPLLLWLSNLWSGVVSLTLPGRRVLMVDKEGILWDWGSNLIELGGPKNLASIYGTIAPGHHSGGHLIAQRRGQTHKYLNNPRYFFPLLECANGPSL